MKLRVRCIETKETLRIEVPNLSSLQDLKQTLSQLISASPSSLRFSLNRHDELHASSPHDPLHSLGIASGDLIFYTLDPSLQTLASTHSSVQSPNQIDTATSEPQGSNFPNPETQIGEGSFGSGMDGSIAEEQRPKGSNSETLAVSGAESMEIDDASAGLVGNPNKYSVPFFLRRVLREELAEDRSDHKVLVIAVHAVLLESGFVGFDLVSGMQTDRFHLAGEWPTRGFMVSLPYTLPEILNNRGDNGNAIEGMVLKFQSLGRFVNVYGSVAGGGSGHYRVCLDEKRFAPMIEFVWANRDATDGDGFVPKREVFEFWRSLKDGIALPLLIDLCEKAGLPTPPTLVRIPSELQMKILYSLPGADIAKVGCVCKELRNLANSDELWKKKYGEEFGDGTGGQGMVHWKFRFAGEWKTKQLQRKAEERWREYERTYPNPLRRDPNPLLRRPHPNPLRRGPNLPRIIGGYHDIFPVFGGDYDCFPGLAGDLDIFPGFAGDHDIEPGLGVADPDPFEHIARGPARRNVSPNCNLGG